LFALRCTRRSSFHGFHRKLFLHGNRLARAYVSLRSQHGRSQHRFIIKRKDWISF
jgi:hypothetical protein